MRCWRLHTSRSLSATTSSVATGSRRRSFQIMVHTSRRRWSTCWTSTTWLFTSHLHIGRKPTEQLRPPTRTSSTFYRKWWKPTGTGQSFALWGYRTSIQTSTGATPYSLVYGMEAVLPIEIEIPSLPVLAKCQIVEADWQQSRFEELMLFDERRLKALYHVQGYQQRIARAFNKKI